jgi:uncharacterized protein YndB with AHSA1/START domain
MREFLDHDEAVIDGDARAVFEAITDIEHLPEWNRTIQRVLDRPARLAPGATWTVEMHPSPLVRWKSRSMLTTLDRENLRITYRTVNANGNGLTRCGVGS